MKDFHRGQRVEQQRLGNSSGCNVEFLGVRHQWGKADFEQSIHAFPSGFTLSGSQTTDLLGLLGFERRACAFRSGQECYSVEVLPGLDLSGFPSAFDSAYGALVEAERRLDSCGFHLPQREGWGYFTGRATRRELPKYALSGDGHSAAQIEERKQSEDDAFRFVLSWMSSGSGNKGWITHFRAKNQPVSAEITNVLSFLGLRSFSQCHFFDFEECWWSSIAYNQHDDSPFNRSIEYAARSFDNLQVNFSPGISKLLEAHAHLEPYGLKLLPIPSAAARKTEDLQKYVDRASGWGGSIRGAQLPEIFDVAISFAGTERAYAEALAKRVREAGFNVFYDDFYPAQLWGKNLYDFFHEIYSKRARFCVMFVSKDYAERVWTNHERQSAQERMLKEKGKEYLLPVRVDEAELPGLLGTIGYYYSVTNSRNPTLARLRSNLPSGLIFLQETMRQTSRNQPMTGTWKSSVALYTVRFVTL
jgi:hypothetical protein